MDIETPTNLGLSSTGDLPPGLIVPMLTPLTPGGDIDETATELLIEFVLREQANGIFVLGSAGEGDSLPLELQRDFAALVAARVGERVPLFLGAMQASTLQQIDFLHSCRVREKYMAVVSPLPFYRRPRCETEVIEHYRRLRGATDRSVVAYRTPHPSAKALTVPVLMHLAESGLLAALKDSSGRIEGFRELIRLGFNESGVRLYQGEPSLSLESLRAGGDGLVVGTANFIPWVFVELRAALRAGDQDRAERCQERVLAFRKFARLATPYSAGGFHFSTFKAGLQVMEFGGGTPCPPYQPLPEDWLPHIRGFFLAAGVREHTVQALRACQLSQRARRWAQVREQVQESAAAETSLPAAANPSSSAVLDVPASSIASGGGAGSET
jgi:4-hydroxy-tetrahydrodipicolinate synthase